MVVYLILHYKNADVTEQCMDALLSGDVGAAHIVVVDNASDNGSFEVLIEKYKDRERIHFLKNEENLGYAAGNNVGFRFAKKELGAEWIVLLNNDVVIEQKDFQKRMMQEYETVPFYVAGPDIATPQGGSQNPFRMNCPDKKKMVRFLVHDILVRVLMRIGLQQKWKKIFSYDGSIFQPNEVDTIRNFQGVLHGSCLIFSPDFVKEFNGLYEGTFLYCEEEILCYILKRLGYNYSYLKSLRVIHCHSVSMKREIADENQRKMQEIRRRIVSYWKFFRIAGTGEKIGDYLM